MTALDFLADARRWQGAALLEGLRQAPNRIQFSPVSERAGLATRLAKASPVHALLAVLPDHPGCAAYFKAAYAQNPGLALTWASYAVSCPPWSLHPWVESHRAQLRQALIAEPTRPLSFAFQAAYRAAYSGSLALPLRQAFYRWLAARLPTPTPAPGQPSGDGARPVVGLLGESFHDNHVLKRTCQPEIDALRQAGFAVWLLQTGAQCRPVSGIDGIVPLLWNGQALRRGAGPALDALILLEPFGTIVDAVGAGQRWAPIQLACAVTPTPVGSPQLDYWLQGQNALFAAEAPVLAVPGVGVTRWHEAPRSPLPWSAREGLVVASAPHKWSAPFLGWLAELVKGGVPLRLLPGSAVPASVLQRALAQVLPRRGWSLQAGCSHAEYLDILSRARCALDAFPYGGLTTIADAASTGTPMLLPPGDNGTQRVAQALGQHYGHGVPVASPADVAKALDSGSVVEPTNTPPPLTWLPALRALGLGTTGR